MAKNRVLSEKPQYGCYQQMLIERRRAVLADLGAKADVLTKIDRVGEEDLAQQSHEEFISLRLNGLEYFQLKQVEEALDRMQSGDYGICLACEEPIPPKRLNALPWARYCVPCQERLADKPYRDTEVVVGDPDFM